MARKTNPTPMLTRPLWRRLLALLARGLLGVATLYLLLILTFAFLPPPGNLYQWSESWRLGGIQRQWVNIEDIAPAMARSVVAGEDANFCLHWGFDMAAIRDAIQHGSNRGASTLDQQTVKNVLLWQGRSWVRKAMEAVLTPVVELLWSKQRILELYLNEAEFAEGVFGVQAAAQHYWKKDAADLTAIEGARLASVLPNPKDYNAGKPGPYVKGRARQIIAGAETIKVDGRAACFAVKD
ncbi:MAG: monofunctional biosynthetic peptidoglycan transglycosylase [Pseudorhodobacter sp.]|nr:monofunctional biosynthetic peptidoglycan transglycosylase [Pseudorhodobacter sp.]